MYAIGLLLLLLLIWVTIPYLIGVAIILIVINHIIKLIRKQQWNS